MLPNKCGAAGPNAQKCGPKCESLSSLQNCPSPSHGNHVLLNLRGLPTSMPFKKNQSRLPAGPDCPNDVQSPTRTPALDWAKTPKAACASNLYLRSNEPSLRTDLVVSPCSEC